MKMSSYRKRLQEERDALMKQVEEIDQKIARVDSIREEMKLLEDGGPGEDAVD